MKKIDAKFLVVDDFQSVRITLSNLLKTWGFEKIENACDGQDAMAKILEAARLNEQFTLIFCDWNMPEVSGLEVLRFCRENSDLKSIPIIMITAEAEQKHIVKAVQLGVNEYIIKPFDKSILEEKMMRVLKKVGIEFEDLEH